MLTVTNIGNTFNDLLVVNAARVSFGKRHNCLDPIKDIKLINYLVKHDHWSPLAHPHATVKLYMDYSAVTRLISNNSVMAGLTLRKAGDDALWVITGSLWALLQLSYLIPNHALFWAVYVSCPLSTEAFMDKYEPPFKIENHRTDSIEEFITNDDTFTFHVKAPVFVARQLVKHQQKLVWNEISRRYVDSEPEFYDPKKMPTILQENSGLVEPDGWENLCGWRGKAADKKQGSSGLIDFGIDIPNQQGQLDMYNYHISKGMCPEQARMYLPLNLITEWYWSGTREAFNRVVDLRTKPDSQLETAYIATQIGAYLNAK